MRSIGPAVTREQSPAFLRNSNGRLDFPGPPQEASCIPRPNSRILLHLEKNHVVPPSSQDVALCRHSVSGEVPLSELDLETVLVTLDATHKVPRHPGLPREEHRSFPAPLPLSLFYPPDLDRRVEEAQRRGCRKTSVFLSRETGISGNFVGRIQGAKCPFDLQFLTWDFS